MSKKFFPAGLFCCFLIAGWLILHLNSGKNSSRLDRVQGRHDAPAEAFEEWQKWEYDLLKDPATGRIPEGIFAAELAQAIITPKRDVGLGAIAKTTNHRTWAVKGPTNLGGRTRDLAISVANNNVMLAGSVSGGIWRSANGGASWTNVTPIGNIRTVTSIAQDTRAGFTNTWYYVNGEALGNSASAPGAFYFGNGVYKSTDDGVTWTRLVNSNTGVDENFDSRLDLCHRVVVDPTNGNVYVAGIDIIARSTDGGNTWATVLGPGNGFISAAYVTDVVVTSSGRLYAAFSGESGSSTLDGVWTSTTGNAGSWTRIAGNGSPAGWNTHSNYGRVVLSIAPSQQDTLFALYDNHYVNTCANPEMPEADLFRYSQSANAWTDLTANLPNEPGCLPGNDPFAVQGGYDLCIAVKPDNANTVFVGGTNAYRSTDGFTSNTMTTRIGGYNSPADYQQYPNHHPDIHNFKFASGNNNLLYTVDDGGIQRGNITQTPVTWTELNNNYLSFQYYHVALDPVPNSGLTLGGAQDNGTTFILNNQTTGNEYIGGDGASCGMDSNGVTFFSSVQLGQAFREAFLTGFVRIDPANDKSLFVTNFHVDPDRPSHIYYANGNDLYRNGSSQTATQTNWTLLTGLSSAIPVVNKIYAIQTSRGPYNSDPLQPATLRRLYVGTDNSQIFRLDDPINVPPGTAPANITPAGASGTCINIAVHPTDSRIVLAVYSNYGVVSAWFTSDASVASPVWSNVEGNISLLSFRSCAILSSGGMTEYFVGTSKGIYSTSILNGASTVWTQEAASLIGFVPVAELFYRTGDNNILAGTHGNGMFLSTGVALPIHFVSFAAHPGKADHAQLSWDVSNEGSVSGYIVQRSADGIKFEDVERVEAVGGNGLVSYTTEDKVPVGSTLLYYRVKAVEAGQGNGYFTAVKTVRFDGAASEITVYPTVFSSMLQVYVPEEGFTASLTDMRGAQVGTVPLQKGYNAANLSHLPAGTYLISVRNKGAKPFTQRIVKQ